jgi:hypothetical protein
MAIDEARAFTASHQHTQTAMAMIEGPTLASRSSTHLRFQPVPSALITMERCRDFVENTSVTFDGDKPFDHF